MVFKGWARMALPVQAFNVVEVRKPNVGQNKPASVTADILLDTKSAIPHPAVLLVLHAGLITTYEQLGWLVFAELLHPLRSVMVAFSIAQGADRQSRGAGLRGDVRSEWDETKQHDVLFLLTVQPPDQVALAAIKSRGEEPTPAQQHGLIYVRGAEVIEVRREHMTQPRSLLAVQQSHANCNI